MTTTCTLAIISLAAAAVVACFFFCLAVTEKKRADKAEAYLSFYRHKCLAHERTIRTYKGHFSRSNCGVFTVAENSQK